MFLTFVCIYMYISGLFLLYGMSFLKDIFSYLILCKLIVAVFSKGSNTCQQYHCLSQESAKPHGRGIYNVNVNHGISL